MIEPRDLRRAALALFDLTQGSVTFADIMEMDVSDFLEWLEDAVEHRREMNRAMQSRG